MGGKASDAAGSGFSLEIEERAAVNAHRENAASRYQRLLAGKRAVKRTGVVTFLSMHRVVVEA